MQAIVGLRNEFFYAPTDIYPWKIVNGMYSLIIALGLLYFALILVKSRGWRFLNQVSRDLICDYGVPLLVIIFSAISYGIRPPPPPDAPVPDRFEVSDPWSPNN